MRLRRITESNNGLKPDEKRNAPRLLAARRRPSLFSFGTLPVLTADKRLKIVKRLKADKLRKVVKRLKADKRRKVAKRLKTDKRRRGATVSRSQR